MSVLRRCSIFQQSVICVASWQKPQSLPKHTRTHYVKTHTQTFKMSTKTAAADILNGRQAWLYMHTLRRTFNHHWSRGAPTQTPLRCMFILYTCNQTKRALINQQAISYTSICMLCVCPFSGRRTLSAGLGWKNSWTVRCVLLKQMRQCRPFNGMETSKQPKLEIVQKHAIAVGGGAVWHH